MKKGLFQSAEENWPEDEAALEAAYQKGGLEAGETKEDMGKMLENSKAHMKKVFMEHEDGEALYVRYENKLNELLK